MDLFVCVIGLFGCRERGGKQKLGRRYFLWVTVRLFSYLVPEEWNHRTTKSPSR